MSAWRRRIVPGLAVVAAFFLVVAAAAGIDEIATAKIPGPMATGTVLTTTMNTEPGLEHILRAGLDKGSLPGGFPTDEPREEKYDENYLEILHFQPRPAA